MLRIHAKWTVSRYCNSILISIGALHGVHITFTMVVKRYKYETDSLHNSDTASALYGDTSNRPPSSQSCVMLAPCCESRPSFWGADHFGSGVRVFVGSKHPDGVLGGHVSNVPELETERAEAHRIRD